MYLAVLKALIGFLVEVAAHSSSNMMDSKNLSISLWDPPHLPNSSAVFGPNIFNKQDVRDMLRADNPAMTCTQYFIDNYAQIFGV